MPEAIFIDKDTFRTPNFDASNRYFRANTGSASFWLSGGATMAIKIDSTLIAWKYHVGNVEEEVTLFYIDHEGNPVLPPNVTVSKTEQKVTL